jgi:cobalt-precorrin-5B (C1)-methyltransferase
MFLTINFPILVWPLSDKWSTYYLWNRKGDLVERYIEKEGKTLRYGYTTGSCAAAAAKAGVIALFTGKVQKKVHIDTPKGWILDIDVYGALQSEKEACFYVIKDGGDDPDVTHGIKIYASVRKSETPGIVIDGGMGVGRVTKRGLRVEVGKAAINPVPLRMIETEVLKILPQGEGVSIIISVPEGIEVAKRTFNAKLGIIGGISILGTSGVVEPMSEDAFKESLKIEMSVLAAAGKERLVFTFGNFGRDYMKAYGIKDSIIQKTSNFVAYMLDAARELNIKEILYVGHMGKMVKLAAGMENTHSKYGDNRMESILFCGKDYIRRQEEEKAILACNTTDEAYEKLIGMGIEQEVLDAMARRCQVMAEKMGGKSVKVECIIFSTIYGTLSKTSQADKWLKELSV